MENPQHTGLLAAILGLRSLAQDILTVSGFDSIDYNRILGSLFSWLDSPEILRELDFHIKSGERVGVGRCRTYISYLTRLISIIFFIF